MTAAGSSWLHTLDQQWVAGGMSAAGANAADATVPEEGGARTLILLPDGILCVYP
eukprot:CAMPEP_0119415674 /NCGR_PEP_ID=MMETSP1335-20130426/10087_1 /TAXON_ID=259385 /ORGANISM="Chrysoculter rhomboideus, Strain RCC1486" /LENGTH=54 /DNA_ID=CAMNT_0007440705 /DNA_START=17 /DNA_END=179 /DNA_ORIENTATION=-